MNKVLSRSAKQFRQSVATRFTRRDFATAALVEQSLALQDQAGTKFAAVFLDYKGISVDIALRVLLKPAQRRQNYIVSELQSMYA